MPSVASDLLALTKPRLSSLVLFTTAGGIYLAPGSMSVTRVFVTLLATAGVVGAANALNEYMERDSDRFMPRTASRPLPAGRMEPAVALWFGIAIAAVCIPALYFSANLLTAALAALAFFSYVLMYTPLKARSHHAMLMGALPGALPPLMGWTAKTGSVGAAGLILFAVLFFWQLPHFLAIALFRKEEYAAAGLKSVPLVKGDAVARWQAVGYIVPLIAASIALYVVHAAGMLYLIAAVVLGAALLAEAVYGIVKNAGHVWAKQLFLLSLVYLSGLFLALWIDGGVRV
ncbi:MAG: heme o synthase [Myxococcaceae bacterium]